MREDLQGVRKVGGAWVPRTSEGAYHCWDRQILHTCDAGELSYPSGVQDGLRIVPAFQ